MYSGRLQRKVGLDTASTEIGKPFRSQDSCVIKLRFLRQKQNSSFIFFWGEDWAWGFIEKILW